MTRIFAHCILAGAMALGLLAASAACAQNGNGNGIAANGQPATQTAGAQLLINLQSRDGIVSQLRETTALAQLLDARGANSRALLGSDGALNFRSFTNTLAVERARANDLVAEVRRQEGRTDRAGILVLLERFEARFPPNFATSLERIDAEFKLGVTDLRQMVEGAPRLDHAELGRSVNTFLNLLSRYQQSVTNGLARLRESASLPSNMHDLVQAASLEAMATPAQTQQFADLYRARLNDMEQQVRAITIGQANERAQLLNLFNAITEQVQPFLARLQNERTRSEEMLIQQAERTFGHNVNEGSFKWMLVIFGIAFVVLILVPWLYRNADTHSIPGQLLTSNFILQFCTVFILTASIVLLGIGRYIEKDQLPVLLAGISGYVLGQLGRSQRVSEEAAAK
jgi:hypothetical protein